MVPIKTATVTSYPVVQSVLPDGSLDNVALGTGITGIECYLQVLTPEEVFMAYNVELSSPALIQIEVADAAKFDADFQVVITGSTGSGRYNGTVYRVHGQTSLHDDGFGADHAAYLLDQKTYPIGAIARQLVWLQERLIGVVDGTNATFATSELPIAESITVNGGNQYSTIPQIPGTAWDGTAFDGTGKAVVFNAGYIPVLPDVLWARYQTYIGGP